ncbi:MAG: hypothetical protein A2Z38_10490 [Planctomycetes bacterium RBG_19FT_COMBO_48_8]|nr:MAG: hypothetical protein A2Z38_10490 [Planctomycetes bacterium RBG_19FT_COMBO_48_8]
MKLELQFLREWNDELKKEFEDFKKDDKMWDKEKIRAFTQQKPVRISYDTGSINRWNCKSADSFPLK